MGAVSSYILLVITYYLVTLDIHSSSAKFFKYYRQKPNTINPKTINKFKVHKAFNCYKMITLKMYHVLVMVNIKFSLIRPCVNTKYLSIVLHCPAVQSMFAVVSSNPWSDPRWHLWFPSICLALSKAVSTYSIRCLKRILVKTWELTRVEVMFNVREESDGGISSEMRATGRPRPLQRN